MSAKSERITILGSTDFKSFLLKEAEKEGVSLSELVRQRCQNVPASNDERLLMELVSDVTTSTKRARKSLNQGIVDAEQVIKELKELRSK